MNTRCFVYLTGCRIYLVSPLGYQTAGTVPPSITYSLPLIDNALSETRNATSSATSSGRPGRPMESLQGISLILGEQSPCQFQPAWINARLVPEEQKSQ